MDEERNEQENEESPESSRTRVGFPQPQPEKKSSKKGPLFALILLLLLLGAGAWYLFSGKEDLMTAEDITSTPTEFIEETSTPAPTIPEIEREGVKIQVLNGTGIAGAAGELQKALEALGYSDIKVGNASGQTAVKTTVVFDPDVDEAVMNEITEKLDKIYEDVTSSEKAQTSYDIVITTGYPIGYKASPTPTRSTGTTPTSSVSPSASPAATKTPTPTP